MKSIYSNHLYKVLAVSLLAMILWQGCNTQQQTKTALYPDRSAGDDAEPWVFYYWMHGALNKQAITADLEAMKRAGLGGAYIFSIRDVTNPPLYNPSYRTLTPEWWSMVKHAASVADSLGLYLGMHSCDGFTCAGGPWITPEMSMQKVVWADTIVDGDQTFDTLLPQPDSLENYYKDIAVYAYPAPVGAGESSFITKPVVTSSIPGKEVQFLAEKESGKQFGSDDPCWVQFAFDKPFTCRSITLGEGWNNYQSNRLIVEVSDDGVHFKEHQRLEPPRSGWEDLDANATQLIKPVTAKYFRFVYDPKGSEPGAEDIDDAKWAPKLRLEWIELSGEAKIQQFEGKSGAIWRIAARNSDTDIPESECVDLNSLKDITANLKEGHLKWNVPAGKWVILRMGHTSTGKTNYIGGGGLGLECDKLNPEAVKFQYDQWFGEIFRQVGIELGHRVLKRFHVDSWECGSQNWSPVFRDEFQKRRGYDLYKYLPVMAGIPIKNTEFSEKILSDVRETISELIDENFYQVFLKQAHDDGCEFSAESVAPVGVSDGMLYFKDVDLPMGEFWLRSPSHDKPNDILDAISGAHVYGKNIVQSEALTEIRIDWDEHPGNLKPVIDRNFALGINKLFIHVFTLNPWMDRKPGMTLDRVGTYFQRDQTWWKPGAAFVDYLTNCQGELQKGKPVVDLAVFTGEEIPNRAILPDRLVPVLPGIMGKERVKEEQIRLKNEGTPVRHFPKGVTTQENMADPDEWLDPLNGYAYDSFNKDVLLRLAKVENGRVVLPGGASYGLLIIPGDRKMAPNGGEMMSVEVAQKLLDLAKQGATILFMQKPFQTPGLSVAGGGDAELQKVIDELFSGDRTTVTDPKGGQFVMWKKGLGRIIHGPYQAATFDQLGITKDVEVLTEDGTKANSFVWNHRVDNGKDIYFLANQEDSQRMLDLSFRMTDKTPKIYDPVTNTTSPCKQWIDENGRISLSYQFAPNQSLFVLFSKDENVTPKDNGINWVETTPIQTIDGSWHVQFDPAFGGPKEPVTFNSLTDWSKNKEEGIRYYSGTANYTKTFEWNKELDGQPAWLELGTVDNLAEVRLNGDSLGVCWTAPFRVRIDKALKQGENKLEISVTNTWANRLKGDHDLPEDKRITWTTAPYRMEGRPLLPAGLLGPVVISLEKKD